MSRSRIARLVVLSLGAVFVAALAVPTSARQPKGKKYALLVGVKDYKGESFSELKYPERDVEELAKILRKSGYEVRLLTTVRGKDVRADEPTAANIRKEFTTLIKGRARGDTVLLALCGHGMQIEVKDKRGEKEPISYGYFCPSDADVTDISYSTGYSDHLILVADILESLGKCQATNKFVLMDACRNETSVKARSRNVEVPVEKVPRGVAALFSCSKRERAWEHDDLKHGVFFHFVLRGLRGEAKNKRGAVTWDQLSAYVKSEVIETVPQLLKDGAKQTPHGVNNVEGDPLLLLVEDARSILPAKGENPNFRFGLALKYRKASQKDFVKEQAYGIECFQEQGTQNTIHISNTAALSVLGKGLSKSVGKRPLFQHGLELAASKANLKEKDRRFGLECFADGEDLVYICETGSLSVVPGKFATLTKGKPKGPDHQHTAFLRVRPSHEVKWERAERYNAEVFVDSNNDCIIYISETGCIAVLPSQLTNESSGKGDKLVWQYELNLRTRVGSEKQFGESTRAWGVEVYEDRTNGCLIYAVENGNIAVVPSKLAKVLRGKAKGPKAVLGYALAVREHDEQNFTLKTKRFGVETYLDENNGNLIYISENGAIAVVPPEK